MDKMEKFKKFVSSRPYLKDKVDAKKTSWQELFEHYDLYGEDDEIFIEEKQERKQKSNFSNVLDMLSGIDIDKIADGLNGMKKVLNILSEVMVNDENPSYSKRKMNQPYSRDDD
ncbi:MAG: spore coat protein YlbD [Bacillales bacterium]|nr:spore coat protein YlbD [Bacillales bacterium]